MSAFGDVTTPVADPDVPGAYTCRLAQDWDGPGVPHGGVLVAVGLRALRSELGDSSYSLRSATATFCRSVRAHDLVVEASVARRGNLVAQVRGDLRARSHVGTGVALIATFGRERQAVRLQDAQPPDVPGWQDCPEDEPPTRAWNVDTSPSIFDRFEARRALGAYPWDPDWAPGPARFVRWMRYKDGSGTAEAGAADPVALVPPADLPGPAVWQGLGPQSPLHFMASLELSVRFLDPVEDEWLLCDYRSRHIGDGYCITESDLWSAGRLVATCSQMMMLRTPRLRPDEAPGQA